MIQERRTAPRYRLDAEIAVNDGTGRTRDISSNGVFFETRSVLARGDEVALVLPFQQTAPGTRVQCRAHVVRLEAKGRTWGVAATYEPIGFSVSV